MKIIHVLNQFLPHQTAGTEVYVWALTKALQKDGNELKVLIPNYTSSKSENYNYDGILVHQYAEPTEVDRQLIMGFREPDGLSAFKIFLNEEKPDIIHFHELAGSNGIGMAHVREAKKTGAKIVMTFHLAGYTCATGTLMYKGSIPCDGKISISKCSACYLHKKGLKNTADTLAGISTFLFRIGIDSSKLGNSLGTMLGTANIINRKQQNLNEIIHICHKVVCITDWYKNVLEKNNLERNKIKLIKQGLPILVNFGQIKSEKNKNLKLMYLGRITRIKGIEMLINVMQILKDENIELHIFGNSDGSNLEEDLKKQTSKDLNIFWRGGVHQTCVIEEMSKFDLLCLCSNVSEMSPLVIQEARAAKLPVLASNVLGCVEQIEHDKNGLLFESNNKDSLLYQIKRVLSNRELLNQLKKNQIESRSFATIAAEYSKLYEKSI
jgi:glycosyltransferase involved in cell wall biosynthesis